MRLLHRRLRPRARSPLEHARLPALALFTGVLIAAASPATVGADAPPEARGGSVAAPPATAPEPVAPSGPPASVVSLLLGITWWPGLADLQPAPPYADVRFNAWNPILSLAGESRIARMGDVDLLLGGELDLIFAEGPTVRVVPVLPAGTSLQESIDASAGALLVTLRARFGDGPVRPFLGVGLGGYLVAIRLMTSDMMELDTYTRQGAFGGWAGGGADFRFFGEATEIGIRVQVQAHLVLFGAPGSFAPASGSFGDLIVTFAAGPVICW